DDSREVRAPVLEPHRDARRGAAGGLAEPLEDARDRLWGGAVGGGRLDRRPPDLRLQLRGRALGDDVPVVDDPDAVGECVGLLEVLRGQEDGHPVLSRQSCDLAPERASALYVETGRRLVEEEARRAMGEREREVEAALQVVRLADQLTVSSEA